jgi:benzoyl-CoA reductase/2-hydroxyglutaryl-CoA dehydratase subunit BcrC/BadD/HgdB
MAQTRDCLKLQEETLDALAAQQDRPAGMEAFDRFFRDNAREKELDGVPVVGQLCNFAPEELILAAGAVPVRLDIGCHHAAGEGEKLIPAEICCSVHAALGAVEKDLWPAASKLDLLIIATSCDAKKKLSAALSETREVFTLQLPVSHRETRAREWWRKEIERLAERLSKLTGKKITRGSLKEAVGLINRRTQAVRRLNDLRRNRRPPISGADALLVMQTAFLADVAWWVEQTESLCDELEQRVAAEKGQVPRARILLSGSPVLWPDFKLPLLVQECGADVVADELCSGTQRLHHPVVVDEWTRGGLLRAAAERVLLPCTCPCFQETGARQDRLQELVESHQIDGILHHTLRLCQLYDMDAARLQKLFKEKDIPWQSLRTDFSPEDIGRIKNRIEAFVEMVSAG